MKIQKPTITDFTNSTHNHSDNANGGVLSNYQAVSEKGQANGYASLDSGGKVPVSELPSSIMEYKGTWDASTNTPTLIDGTGNNGDVYRVSIAGTQNLGSGDISFEVGDYVIYNGTTWEKSDTTDAVATVNGMAGNVVLNADDIALDTSTFDKNLDDTVTNVQLLAQAVDELEAGASNSWVYNEVPTGAIDGVNTSYTLVSAPIVGSLMLFMDGLLQKSGVGNDYIISGTAITFNEPPLTGSVLLASYQQSVGTSGNADTLDGQHGSYYLDAGNLTGDLSNSLFGLIRFLYPFGSYTIISPVSLTGHLPFSSTLPSFTTYPLQYSQAVFIGATNNASNYWTIELREAGTNTVVASVNTASQGTNTGVTLVSTTMLFSSLTQASQRYLFVRVTKTGSPSDLFVHCPAVEYKITA